ncbi:MAG: fibronectin type III domain-containing protein [Gammaproteobacteria bacterium]|nr:fibronectin type III domain-containing protein [Gammaproteobacteria bacterium]
MNKLEKWIKALLATTSFRHLRESGNCLATIMMLLNSTIAMNFMVAVASTSAKSQLDELENAASCEDYLPPLVEVAGFQSELNLTNPLDFSNHCEQDSQVPDVMVVQDTVALTSAADQTAVVGGAAPVLMSKATPDALPLTPEKYINPKQSAKVTGGSSDPQTTNLNHESSAGKVINNLSQNIPPWQTASAWPDRIIQNFSDDPTRTITVTWRTDSTVRNTIAQIALSTADARFDQASQDVNAVTEALNLSAVMVDSVNYDAPHNAGLGTVHYHSVVFRDLLPDTMYAYRVQGADGAWSEWYQTRTAPESGPIRLVYFGDAQNGILSHWSRVIRAAYQSASDARFFLHAGDMVDIAASDYEWAEWFKAGGFVHGILPSVVVVGNHETQRYGLEEPLSDRVLSHLWRPQFTLPVESELPVRLHETVYDVRYNADIHLFVLNSAVRQDYELQAQWLDRLLIKSDARWKILTMHHPIFSSGEGRDDSLHRDTLLPILNKHRVDLVLQGHDHSYARGAIGQYPERIALGEGDGVEVMFVNSVSGQKMYKMKPDGWDGYAEHQVRLHRAAENTPFYQVISIDGPRLMYEAFTADNQLYDYFEMVKGANGLKSLSKGGRQTMPARRFANTGEH